jgi:hypothetical protein
MPWKYVESHIAMLATLILYDPSSRVGEYWWIGISAPGSRPSTTPLSTMPTLLLKNHARLGELLVLYTVGLSCTDLIQGTWDYMSGNLLSNVKARHVHEDDLESFAWVLLSQVMRLGGLADPEIFKKVIFDMCIPIFGTPGSVNGHNVGGYGKIVLLTCGTIHVGGDEFAVINNPPVNRLCNELFKLFAQRYTRKKRVITGNDVKKLFEGALNSPDWPAPPLESIRSATCNISRSRGES